VFCRRNRRHVASLHGEASASSIRIGTMNPSIASRSDPQCSSSLRHHDYMERGAPNRRNDHVLAMRGAARREDRRVPATTTRRWADRYGLWSSRALEPLKNSA